MQVESHDRLLRPSLVQAGGWMLLVWAGLLLWRAPNLTRPPYEDQAVGLWTEADFLARSGFDYLALRFDERHYTDLSDPRRPGVRSYMISVLPTLLAVLMRVCDEPKTCIVVAHVVTLAVTASVVVLTFLTVRPLAGSVVAALAAACIVTTPLFSTQVDMVGMDLPLAAATTACLACVARRRWGWAVAVSALAFLMKSTGIVVTGALAAVLLPWCVESSRGNGSTSLRAARRGVLLLLAVELLLMALGDPLPQLRGTALPWPDSFRLPWAAWLYVDVIAALVVMLVLTAALVLRRPSRVYSRLADRATGEPLAEKNTWTVDVVRLSWLILAGLVLGMSRWIALPRYWTAAVPLVWISLALWSGVKVDRRRWAAATMLLVIAANVSNQYGRWMPDISPFVHVDELRNAFVTERSCVYQERSRAYQQEQETWRRLFRELERRYASHTIFLPHPYWYYARNPRLGYVSRPLHAVLASDCDFAWSQLIRLAGKSAAIDRPPVLVRVGLSRITLPPPNLQDEIVFRDESLSPVVAYLPAVWNVATQPPGGPSDPADATATTEALSNPRQRRVQDWLTAATHDRTWRPQRAFFRAPFLASNGQWDQARQEIDRSLHDDPAWTPLLEQALLRVQRIRADAMFWPRLRSEYPELAVALTRVLHNETSARTAVEDAISWEQDTLRAALDWLAAGQFGPALTEFRRAQQFADNGRQQTLAVLAGQVLLACRGEQPRDIPAEGDAPGDAIDLDQQLWTAILQASRRTDAAADIEPSFDVLTRAAADCPTVHRELAAWLARREHYAKALTHAEWAIRLDSKDTAATLHRGAILRRSAAHPATSSVSDP